MLTGTEVEPSKELSKELDKMGSAETIILVSRRKTAFSSSAHLQNAAAKREVVTLAVLRLHHSATLLLALLLPLLAPLGGAILRSVTSAASALTAGKLQQSNASATRLKDLQCTLPCPISAAGS